MPFSFIYQQTNPSLYNAKNCILKSTKKIELFTNAEENKELNSKILHRMPSNNLNKPTSYETQIYKHQLYNIQIIKIEYKIQKVVQKCFKNGDPY